MASLSMLTSFSNSSSLLTSSSPFRIHPWRISTRGFLGNNKKVLFLRKKLPTEFQSLNSPLVFNGSSCFSKAVIVSKFLSCLQTSTWNASAEVTHERWCGKPQEEVVDSFSRQSFGIALSLILSLFLFQTNVFDAMALENHVIVHSSDTWVTLGSYNGKVQSPESTKSSESTESTEMDRRFKLSNSEGTLFSIAENVKNESTVRGKVLSEPDTGLVKGKLRGCSGTNPCVSTSAFQSPSRFLPPWTYIGDQKEEYFNLRASLIRMGAQVVAEDGERYIYATLEYDGPEDTDDLEFLFTRGKIVCFRSVSRKSVPDPPFCWWKGCINGPRNRGRLEAIRDDLGWTPLETDEEKEWVPLLLH